MIAILANSKLTYSFGSAYHNMNIQKVSILKDRLLTSLLVENLICQCPCITFLNFVILLCLYVCLVLGTRSYSSQVATIRSPGTSSPTQVVSQLRVSILLYFRAPLTVQHIAKESCYDGMGRHLSDRRMGIL
jgi:hypothetical protein